MDDLESQIRQVLGDPAQMRQIMGLAQSLMGERGPEEPPGSPPPPGGGMPGKSGSPPGRQAGPNGQQELLQAIRPYLSEKRQKKVDRAIRITRMAHLAKLAMQGLGGSDDA